MIPGLPCGSGRSMLIARRPGGPGHWETAMNAGAGFFHTDGLPSRPRLYGRQNDMGTAESILTDHIDAAGDWMIKEDFGLSLKETSLSWSGC